MCTEVNIVRKVSETAKRWHVQKLDCVAVEYGMQSSTGGGILTGKLKT